MLSHTDSSTVFIQFWQPDGTIDPHNHINAGEYMQYFQKLSLYINTHLPELRVIGNDIASKIHPLRDTLNRYDNKQKVEDVTFPRVGAFEIMYRGCELFSKRKKKKWPQFKEVVRRIREVDMVGNDIAFPKYTSLQQYQLGQSNDDDGQTQRNTITFITHDDNGDGEQSEGMNESREIKKFSKTDHFKVYKLQKQQLKKKMKLSEKKQKSLPVLKNTKMQCMDNQYPKPQNYPLSNTIPKQQPPKQNHQPSDRQILINLDRIQQQTFTDDNGTRRTNRFQRNRSRQAMRVWNQQLRYLQKKCQEVEKSLNVVKQKNKQFDNSSQVLNHECLDKVTTTPNKNKIGEDKILHGSRSKNTEAQHIQPKPFQYISSNIHPNSQLSPKLQQIDKYIHSSTAYKNKRLNQIYGDDRLLRKDIVVQSRYLDLRQKYQSEIDDGSEQEMKRYGRGEQLPEIGRNWGNGNGKKKYWEGRQREMQGMEENGTKRNNKNVGREIGHRQYFSPEFSAGYEINRREDIYENSSVKTGQRSGNNSTGQRQRSARKNLKTGNSSQNKKKQKFINNLMKFNNNFAHFFDQSKDGVPQGDEQTKQKIYPFTTSRMQNKNNKQPNNMGRKHPLSGTKKSPTNQNIIKNSSTNDRGGHARLLAVSQAKNGGCEQKEIGDSEVIVQEIMATNDGTKGTNTIQKRSDISAQKIQKKQKIRNNLNGRPPLPPGQPYRNSYNSNIQKIRNKVCSNCIQSHDKNHIQKEIIDGNKYYNGGKGRIGEERKMKKCGSYGEIRDKQKIKKEIDKYKQSKKQKNRTISDNVSEKEHKVLEDEIQLPNKYSVYEQHPPKQNSNNRQNSQQINTPQKKANQFIELSKDKNTIGEDKENIDVLKIGIDAKMKQKERQIFGGTTIEVGQGSNNDTKSRKQRELEKICCKENKISGDGSSSSCDEQRQIIPHEQDKLAIPLINGNNGQCKTENVKKYSISTKEKQTQTNLVMTIQKQQSNEITVDVQKENQIQMTIEPSQQINENQKDKQLNNFEEGQNNRQMKKDKEGKDELSRQKNISNKQTIAKNICDIKKEEKTVEEHHQQQKQSKQSTEQQKEKEKPIKADINFHNEQISINEKQGQNQRKQKSNEKQKQISIDKTIEVMNKSKLNQQPSNIRINKQQNGNINSVPFDTNDQIAGKHNEHRQKPKANTCVEIHQSNISEKMIKNKISIKLIKSMKCLTDNTSLGEQKQSNNGKSTKIGFDSQKQRNTLAMKSNYSEEKNVIKLMQKNREREEVKCSQKQEGDKQKQDKKCEQVVLQQGYKQVEEKVEFIFQGRQNRQKYLDESNKQEKCDSSGELQQHNNQQQKHQLRQMMKSRKLQSQKQLITKNTHSQKYEITNRNEIQQNSSKNGKELNQKASIKNRDDTINEKIDGQWEEKDKKVNQDKYNNEKQKQMNQMNQHEQQKQKIQKQDNQVGKYSPQNLQQQNKQNSFCAISSNNENIQEPSPKSSTEYMHPLTSHQGQLLYNNLINCGNNSKVPEQETVRGDFIEKEAILENMAVVTAKEEQHQDRHQLQQTCIQQKQLKEPFEQCSISGKEDHDRAQIQKMDISTQEKIQKQRQNQKKSMRSSEKQMLKQPKKLSIKNVKTMNWEMNANQIKITEQQQTEQATKTISPNNTQKYYQQNHSTFPQTQSLNKSSQNTMNQETVISAPEHFNTEINQSISQETLTQMRAIGVQKYGTQDVGLQISPADIEEQYFVGCASYGRDNGEIAKKQALCTCSTAYDEHLLVRDRGKAEKNKKKGDNKQEQYQQNGEKLPYGGQGEEEERGGITNQSEMTKKIEIDDGKEDNYRQSKDNIKQQLSKNDDNILLKIDQNHQQNSNHQEQQQKSQINNQNQTKTALQKRPKSLKKKTESKAIVLTRESLDDYLEMLPITSHFNRQKQEKIEDGDREREGKEKRKIDMKAERALITMQLYGSENDREKQKYEDKQKYLSDFSPSYKQKFTSWSSITELLINTPLFKPNDIGCARLIRNSCEYRSLQKALTIIGYLNEYLIIRLFENREQSKSDNEVYGVWVCEHYIWKCMIIDGMVPIDEKGQPLGLNFRQNSDKQLWLYLLQKALALTLGGYDHLQTADTPKLLHMLTGTNILLYKIHEQPDKNIKLFTTIKNCKGKNFFIHCQKSSSNIRNYLEGDNNKLVSIYRVDSARIINNEQQVLQVSEIRQSKENKFWMRLERFGQEFQQIEIIQLRMNYNSCRLALENLGGVFSIVCLLFGSESMGSITISNQYKVGYTKVYLYREQKNNTLKLVGKAKQKNKRQLFFDCCFDEGRYYVFVEVEFKGGMITYCGEGKPMMEFIEEVKVNGFRNDYTEYLPIDGNFDEMKESSKVEDESRGIEKRGRKQGQFSVRPKSKIKEMKSETLQQFRQTFINYLVESQMK